ncbi:MAG: DUF5011 domain-containing protein [bacterium]|nr:DUF5011 domain-containing protein [bacterium]
MKIVSGTVLKKIACSILVVALIVPATLLSEPKKAEADVGKCFAQLGTTLAAVFTDKGQAAAYSIPSVQPTPTTDGTIAGSASGNFWDTCVFRPLAHSLGRIMLAEMTKSIVDWINTGFEGSPSFITDPKGFLLDVGDQVVGDYILGTGLAGLCKPFQFQIRIALAVNYSYKSGFGKRSQCTLTDILGNTENAFNDFTSDFTKGGWKSWFTMTGNPYNNPYGAYLEANAEVSAQIGNRKAIELKKLDWGNGFFSYEECDDGQVTWGGMSGNNSGVTVKTGNAKPVGKKTDHGACEVKTPGSTIAKSLDGPMGAYANQIGLADSLDAIFNALANQMFDQIIGENAPGGLLGASSSGGSGSGRSRIDSFVDGAQPGNGSTRDTEYDEWLDGEVDGVETPDYSGGNTPGNTNPPPTVNVALRKNITSSPARSGFPPSKMVNGNREDISGEDFTGFISQFEPNPWVLLNLESDIDIGRIRIFPRTNPGEDSRTGLTFTIKILAKDNSTVIWQGGPYAQDFTNEVDIKVPSEIGRYIRLDGSRVGTPGRLEIAEIEVYPYAVPRITLEGDATMTLRVGDTFTEPGYSAIDNEGNAINNSKIDIDENVNTDVAGRYTITYTAKDSNDGVGTATRDVIVIP